jgi:MFS family permease
MVPGELFTGQRIVALAYTIAFVSGMNFYSLLNFFPLTYTTVYVPDPVQIGLKGLAWGFPTTTGAVFIGAMLSIWKGHNRELLLLATVIMSECEYVFIVWCSAELINPFSLATFGGALAALNPTNPDLAFAFSALAGFGVGGVVVPSATVAMMVVPDALLATTAALSLTIRAIGGSIGYSIYYNIFSNKLKKNLPAYIVQFAIGAGLPVGNATSFVTEYLLDPGQISSFPGITTDILEAAAIGSRWAYADSLKYVWYTSIPFGVTAIFCCALLPSTRKYMTNRIAVQVQH